MVDPRRAATHRVRKRQRLVAQLWRLVARCEGWFDRLLLAIRRRIGHAGPIAIHAYRGFGTPERMWLMGRVVEALRVSLPSVADSRRRNFVRMLRNFLSREIPGATVAADVSGDARVLVQADEEGYFRAALPGALEPAGWRAARLELVDCPLPGWAPMQTRAEVLVPRGDARFAVISDIDDTVLQTHVTHALRMLWVTLSGNPFTRLPFDGTTALYRALAAGVSGPDHNPFFYVSKSPWNLYEFLIEFLEYQGLPRGPVFLRDVGLHETAPLDFKTTVIEELLAAYPALPFVLVGDSGERDPDIYLEIATRHPGRVPVIYIRDVGGGRKRRRELEVLAEEARRVGSELMLLGHAHEALAHARRVGLAWAG
jgi:phosphatidate phosphatase APP1